MKKINWRLIENIIFIISLILVLIAIPSTLFGNRPSTCQEGIGLLGHIMFFSCKYGLKGFLLYLTGLVFFLILIDILIRSVTKEYKHGKR